mgnify:CR=1 FL=1
MEAVRWVIIEMSWVGVPLAFEDPHHIAHADAVDPYPGGPTALFSLLWDVYEMTAHYDSWECECPLGTIRARSSSLEEATEVASNHPNQGW